ncbi:MAG: hypothetical protein A3J73_07160 [Planctomycetes bacterium RIFCSPHIGHO2_02_FULL_38_41]|nr:MAG: hypothetical protein A3J73_07160 [Planctomycetes bacterium RIFCSPHIGHO2_02_FULL_38_41]
MKDIKVNALYIHIPFCIKKCVYCDFNSVVSNTKTIDQYLDAINKELNSLNGRYVFNTIYIGGGTPSVLTEAQLGKLLNNVVSCVQASEIKEFTIEANPGTLTSNKVRLLKEYLVTRVSLGIQSFNDKQLNFLGRIHSGNDAINAFNLLRNVGFDNINIDLIFGCPEQSFGDWESDLRTVIELNPKHLSIYALTYEEGTPLRRNWVNGNVKKLDECVELEMYKTAIGYLTDSGYNHYEISNFAKDGYECLHNYIYWRNEGYTGVGAGAFSFVDGLRTSNIRDVYQYIEGINEGRNIKTFSECLQHEHFASETVIMNLRLRQGISDKDFHDRFGYKIYDRFGRLINRLVEDGLISYDNETLKLTDKGLFVADTVMAEFL